MRNLKVPRLALLLTVFFSYLLIIFLCRGQRTEDRGQRTEDRGQRTEDRGQTIIPISLTTIFLKANYVGTPMQRMED
ncbi:hypothetical protein LEP1GSC047_1082 [Leptospira inadai serovar Lyme str. 10]|uniref:Uncharacterized protein n=1 Tax=Leptospira inadai serovar Lyme str. 10 TaxID=1049790 RepID=V6H937_9LEPT|nr:hypothetical protein LEP1GSC047_1082 [Leptospira inadai serovar Lyme str. 10]